MFYGVLGATDKHKKPYTEVYVLTSEHNLGIARSRGRAIDYIQKHKDYLIQKNLLLKINEKFPEKDAKELANKINYYRNPENTKIERRNSIGIIRNPKIAYSDMILEKEELDFEQEAVDLIAEKAIKRKTGARGLRSIFEKAMTDIMFELPSRDDVAKCIITKETIESGKAPELVLK